MLEVNAISYILLIEALVLALLLLFIGALVLVYLRRRRRQDIDAFANRLREHSAVRDKQSRSYLQVVYELEGVALESEQTRLKAGETRFFEELIQVLYRSRGSDIKLLSESLEALIGSCKSLPPPRKDSDESHVSAAELVAVRQENESLNLELENAQLKLDELVTEFGEIFGGGKDHELSVEEITARVNAIKAGKVAGS